MKRRSFLFILSLSFTLLFSAKLFAFDKCSMAVSDHMLSLAYGAKFLAEQRFGTKNPQNFQEYVFWQILDFHKRYGFGADIEKYFPAFLEKRSEEIVSSAHEKQVIGDLILGNEDGTFLSRTFYIKELFDLLLNADHFREVIFYQRSSGLNLLEELSNRGDEDTVKIILDLLPRSKDRPL